MNNDTVLGEILRRTKGTARGEGGGGGVTTYIFLIRMYPVKTKGEPKSRGRFSHKLPTQIRGKSYML